MPRRRFAFVWYNGGMAEPPEPCGSACSGIRENSSPDFLERPGFSRSRLQPGAQCGSIDRRAVFALVAMVVCTAGCTDDRPAPSAERAPRAHKKLAAGPTTRRVQPRPAPKPPTAVAPADDPREAQSHESPSSIASDSTQGLTPALVASPPPGDDDRIAAHGIRKLAGTHLTLYTDLPLDAEIDRLPELFDQAYPQWCGYFGRDDLADAAWQVRGCLMSDAAKFAQAGLLPDDLPPFKNGYARGNEIWFHEQPSAYYRRHLLLHEATHAFMFAAFGTCGPPWYMEGTAELLGTHSLVAGRLTLGVFPASPDDVPEWGRIRMVREAVAEGRLLTVDKILAFRDDAHLQNEPYGWCWALAAFLDGHPRYRGRFRRLPGELRSADFNARVREKFQDDWPELNEEWRVFAHDLDFGYELVRAATEFAAGEPLTGDKTIVVRVDRGWQSSGLRVEAGKSYRLNASGRYQVADQPRTWWCEPGGVTIRYVDGHPLGMLLAAVLPDSPSTNASSGLLSPVPVGLETTFMSESDGTLYFRINESAAALSDNAGALEVRIATDE